MRVIFIFIVFVYHLIDGSLYASQIEKNKVKNMDIVKILCDGDLALIQHWLKEGGNPNLEVAGGYTPLTLITSEPHCSNSRTNKIVELLLDNGANVNWKDKNGTPPIVAAAQGGAGEGVIRLYLSRNVNVNAVDARGYNALMIFALSGREGTLKEVKFFIEIGVNPSVIAPDGHSALKWIPFAKYPEAHNLIREFQKK
ncbi:MAG: ankyrin repeat domain-containing protein [Methyloligellaceae bacterium]